MATNNNRGFVPVRHINGRADFPVGKMRYTGSAANTHQIYPGDLVFAAASGAIQRYHDAVSGADSKLPLGVVQQVFNSNRRPFTFNQPGAGSYIPASTAGYVTVYEDPGIIYTANCSSTCSYQNVGEFVQVHVCAPQTAAGRSGMGVDLTGTNTAVGHVVKIVGLSPLDGILDEAPISGAVNNDVEVMVVNNVFSNPFRRFETGIGASGTNP